MVGWGPVLRLLLVSSGGLLEWGNLCNSGSGLGCPGLVDVAPDPSPPVMSVRSGLSGGRAGCQGVSRCLVTSASPDMHAGNLA